ncbi:arginase family protein [Bradyrhizobium sp. 141]|uniref:arginase family protein n=1 Tax=Bradyrhizobium sp. 141 TaxID=2782617 RepID=UPI001FF89B8C|nr:arginase family protein [Bradyrhizobium sp. 141]MCK1719803.1 arginase family protein [Bradyrhizobium sp. 141]
MNSLSDVPRVTFLGTRACELSAIRQADIVLFGAGDATPWQAGLRSHAADAPQAVRAATERSAADPLRWDFDQDGPLLPSELTIFDIGDLTTDPGSPEGNRSLIASTTDSILRVGAVPILLGGDDSVPIPFFDAFEKYGPVTILQIDAHLDWRDERDGQKHTFSSTMRRASEMPWIERIVQVGLRGIGGSRATDLADARAWGAQIVTAAMIRQNGIQQVLELIPQNARCIVTLDCDGLDPSVIPGVLVPQPGGLNYLDVVELLQGVSRRARIVAFDLVELMPSSDIRGLGALAAARLVCVMLGCLARQKTIASGSSNL